jgi:uncharacterized protein (TIGR02757 family)
LDYHRLKHTLEHLYSTFDFEDRSRSDPIRFPHNYSEREDIEVSALIASAFAYGRVELFTSVIEDILKRMGQTPYGFLLNLKLKKHRKYLHGVRYRFSSEDDIIAFLYVLSEILKRYKTLERAFTHAFVRPHISTAITGFVELATSIKIPPSLKISRGFYHFFPSPEKGSACKRFALYLRWMVRNRDIDFGIWKEIVPSELVIPLDTHIARISRCLGLTTRKSADWKMAVEITENLKRLDPADPLKYDFALCHQGIIGICRDAKCQENPSQCPILC